MEQPWLDNRCHILWYHRYPYHHWYSHTAGGADSTMRCPRCEQTGTRVIDSRDLDAGSTIRRRRECEACSYRFTTYERAEGARLVVVKRDGSRQDFDRAKLQAGLLKRALEKRPVTLARVEAAVDDIESGLRARGEPEVPSKEIGRLATEALRDIDQLAYIRFASVYHAYEDISTLKREVDRLMKQRTPADMRLWSSPTATSAPRSTPAGSSSTRSCPTRSSRRASTCTSTTAFACSATAATRTSTCATISRS